MKTHATWLWVSALVVASLPACSDGGGSSGGGGEECEPGTEVFCRPCPGNPNEPGTKRCNAEGTAFDDCIPRSGECEIVGCNVGESLFCTCDDGAQGEKLCNADGTGYGSCECGGAGGAGGGGGGAGGGTGGGAMGTKSLFSPCVDDGECDSNSCPMGYCTKSCAKVSDCPFGVAECVPFPAGGLCMPTCKAQVDCDVYGVPSECGYSHAIDQFPVTTCADWLGELSLPPDGSDCSEDVDCNLGHGGEERVCAFEACTQGCYEAKDCPETKECSSMTTLGNCQ